MKIKLLSNKAKLPTRGSEDAAGRDLYAAEGVIIPPHNTAKISTDIAIEIPHGYWGGVFARSGLATKQGLRPANCVGVIDSDYRGPVIVALHNDTDETKEVMIGDRIAQLIILPVCNFGSWEIVDELSDTDRGDGGFGHSGK